VAGITFAVEFARSEPVEQRTLFWVLLEMLSGRFVVFHLTSVGPSGPNRFAAATQWNDVAWMAMSIKQRPPTDQCSNGNTNLRFDAPIRY
jgi:hypothetical protein